MPKKPGGKARTLVRGADGKLYIVGKKGDARELTQAETTKLEDLLAEAEDVFGPKVDAMIPSAAGGGVNLCVPQIF